MSSAQLGPPLIGLFAPRPPLRYIAPSDVAPEKRRTHAITGIAEYVKLLGQDDGYVPTETHQEQQERRRRERKEKFEAKLAEGIEKYNPAEDPEVRGDPYKTLFVSRLAYGVTEADLRAVFEPFGAIDRIRLVNEKLTGKPRGYAFIVFERERDMKAAYKDTDGIKIRDRRICVDVERGRTVKGWKPRSLGGGLGGRHYTQPTRRIDVYPSGPGGYNSRGPSGPPAGRYNNDRPSDRPGGSSYRARSSDRNGSSYASRDASYGAPSAPAYARPAERSSAPLAPPDARPRQGRSGIGFDAAPASRDHRDARSSAAPPAFSSRYSTSTSGHASRPDYDRPRERSRGPPAPFPDRYADRGSAYGPPAGASLDPRASASRGGLDPRAAAGPLDPRAAQHASYQPPVSSHAAAPAAPWLASASSAAQPAASQSTNAYASSRDRYAEQRSSRHGHRDASRERSRDRYGASRPSGRSGEEWEKRARSRDRSDDGDYKRRRY